MQNVVFFDPAYQIANNIGRVVGLSDDGPLLLRKNWEQGAWELETVPRSDLIRINASQFRSLYILLLGVIAALGAPIVAYLGISGRIVGPGIFTVPAIMTVFAYLTLTGSKRMKISFEGGDKTVIFKGSFRSAVKHIPELQQWAARHRIPLAVEFAVPTAHPDQSHS